jgi:hypothetical protein
VLAPGCWLPCRSHLRMDSSSDGANDGAGDNAPSAICPSPGVPSVRSKRASFGDYERERHRSAGVHIACRAGTCAGASGALALALPQVIPLAFPQVIPSGFCAVRNHWADGKMAVAPGKLSASIWTG